MLAFELEPRGSLLTYTVLQSTSEGFEGPLILGLIKLDVDIDNKKTQKPKLLCTGRIAESDLHIGLSVKIKKSDDNYYFTL